MYKSLRVAQFLWLVLPTVLAIMGSPPKNLPPCLNGGSQAILSERYRCSCPEATMDRQCKLTLISIETSPVEMNYGPITVRLNDTTSFHLGLMFITNDPVGDGNLITIRDSFRVRITEGAVTRWMHVLLMIPNKDETAELCLRGFSMSSVVQLNMYLKGGRPGLTLNLGTSTASMEFSNTPVKNDNAWHYLDVFVEMESGGLAAVYLMSDWCRSVPTGTSLGTCMLKQSLTLPSMTFQLGKVIQMGKEITTGTNKFNGCIDKVNLNGEYLDFYNDTWGQKFSQGCQRADQGCQKDGQPFCGKHGVCLNALRETDMLTCRCEMGYQPEIKADLQPHRWSCNAISSPWSTTGNEYNAQFLDIVPGRFRLSFRTRTQTFFAFTVAAWKFYLKVVAGVPQVEVNQNKIQLGKLNVSDGNWHLFDIILTTNYLQIQVDELDKDYIAVTRLSNVTLKSGPVEIVIAKDAQGTCLDDAWVDFVNSWPILEKDYPLVVITKPTYTRHVTWDTTGRQQSCDAGARTCTTVRPCDATATCIDEWRGYRCECPTGLKPDSTGKCLAAACVPNPCVNGNCSTVDLPSGVNFTCICNVGWKGTLCSEPDVSTAELSWWWILLIILLILLIVIVVVVVVCCCKKRAKKKAERDQQKVALENDPFGMDSQLNDPWDSGEKDFIGPIDYTVLQPGRMVRSSPSDTADGQARRDYGPRDHGQKTSDRPPWEQLEGQENPGVNLDQVLEYGYEGYDGKPPPGFCPTEPPPYIGGDEEFPNEDIVQSRPGFEAPTFSRLSNSKSEPFN